MQDQKKKIAIIIPAFKPDFLYQTLESIRMQTNQNFRVYIGDDHSPYDLKSIIIPFMNTLEIVYHRFNENIGKTNLTGHWERCIQLSDEPIIWLFSDDDTMPADGINRILQAIDAYGEEKLLCRFPLNIINEDNHTLYTAPVYNKESISGYDFLLDKLNGKINSAACEFVFSRDVFNHTGGFVKFPMAWCSDDATWVRFANYTTKIILLKGDPVCWRNAHNKNISNSIRYNKDKIKATSLFIKWILRQYKHHPKHKEFMHGIEAYIYTIIRHTLRKNVTVTELYRLVAPIIPYDKRLSSKIMFRHLLKIKPFRRSTI